MAQEVVFRRLFCRGSGCGVMFYICRSCYRGQAYCGDECRGRMRREQKRRAKRRHQQSREGRLDHRDRQRAYREPLPPRARDGSYFRRQRSIGQHRGDVDGKGNEHAIGGGIPGSARFQRFQAAIRIVCIVCGRVGVTKIGQ